MAKPQVQILEDGYRLSIDGVTSEVHDFGDAIEMTTPGGKRYLCMVDLPEEEAESNEIECVLEHWVYQVTVLEADVTVVDDDATAAAAGTASDLKKLVDDLETKQTEGKDQNQ